jgi:drug/metabolite transporter (DMT)-like permease
MFIKIGLHDLTPAGVVFVRTALAALLLLPIAIRSGGMAPLRSRVGALAVLGAVQVAGPFLLISAGERHVASSLAGILVASAPIFTALLAIWIDRSERLQGWAAAGIAIGIVGVALLFGVDIAGSGDSLLGGLMIVLASLGYAIGAFMLKRWFTGYQPLALVAGTMTASAVLTLPLFLVHLPSHVALGTMGAMAALGLGGTGLAFVIYYSLNQTIGPTRTSVVAYVAPGFAVLYGVTLLNESFGLGTALGLLLIVGGSWLAAAGPGRASPEVAAAPDAAAAEVRV